MKAILARFPAMEIDLQIGDRYVDLVEEGIDLAIRIGTLKDSALKVRRIGYAERFCVASLSYLAERPAPIHPEQLRDHQCIVYTLSSAGSTWSCRDGVVPVRGRLRVNTPDAVRSAALDGIGIAYAPGWLFEDGLADGRLQSLLADHHGAPMPIQFVYAANRLLPRRARVFMDFIADVFARDPALNAAANRDAPSTG